VTRRELLLRPAHNHPGQAARAATVPSIAGCNRKGMQLAERVSRGNRLRTSSSVARTIHARSLVLPSYVRSTRHAKTRERPDLNTTPFRPIAARAASFTSWRDLPIFLLSGAASRPHLQRHCEICTNVRCLEAFQDFAPRTTFGMHSQSAGGWNPGPYSVLRSIPCSGELSWPTTSN